MSTTTSVCRATLTEVYGPESVAVKRAPWADENLSEQARLNGRQGVRYMLQEGMTVLDPETMAELPADGQTMGEIMFLSSSHTGEGSSCISIQEIFLADLFSVSVILSSPSLVWE